MGCSRSRSRRSSQSWIFPGCGIADLTGIENFPNLKKLNCAENRITDLSPLPDTLTSLDCSKNAMTELDVSRFTSLTELRCRGLHLEQLDVTALSALKLLDCGDNALSGLALWNETLEELYCDSNQLTKWTHGAAQCCKSCTARKMN